MSSTRTAAAVPPRVQGQQQRSSPTSVASPMNAGQQQQHQHQQQRQQQPSKPKVTPPPRRSKPSSSKHPEMIVDKRIVDELLLVCGVIGSTATTVDEATGQMTEKFVPVTDCLNWLQDLQRALRRDHETYRPISLLLGQWRIVSQKLLPLVMSCRYDKAMVLTVCKILVILTKPLSEDAKRAGRATIDVKNKNASQSVIQEQIVLRDNAIAQSELLMEYKKLFVRHSSHHYAFQNQKNNKNKTNKSEGTGLLSVFTSLLAEPLSKMGSSRTSADHLTIELVLHLMRNLLSITPLNTFGSTEKAQQAAQLHREFLVLLEEEMVFDVLTCVGQEVERRENSGYNLLLMEILSCLLRGQDPTDVALSAVESTAPVFETKVIPSKKKSAKSARTITTARSNAAGSSSLKAHLQSERQKLQLSASSRHSHFGGTLRVSKGDGKQVYVSASDYLARKTQTGGGVSAVGQPARRKNKKAEVFVGSGKASSLHSRPGASASLSREIAGPTSKRAKAALNTFCEKFVAQCYGPVMKSLKNEFRRDSNRLEDGDRTLFFRIVWFFHQWFRVSRRNALEKKKGQGEESSANNLIFTMDVFMFNLVLNSTDEFFEHKKPAELAQTVSLYTEMIHMLHSMYESKDSTEHMMALGLMDRIFYAVEPLDRLPRLLSRWAPGMFSREYLCDLIECSHVTWKLLDVNAKKCLESFPSDKLSTIRPKDAVERMNLTASEFDKEAYFSRKFVSNQIVFMHTQLLSQYAVNAAEINRHIVAYFIRLCKIEVKSGDGDEMEFDDALGNNVLAAKTATMEPMLYNIGLLTVLDTILNDKSIRDKDDFEALLVFASSFMKRFAKASEENPMLYVEALFKHPIPHRFCELSKNMYVTDDLRLIAVRELLLEDQQRFEQAQDIDDERNEEEEHVAAYNDDDEEEEEIEFNDDAMAADEVKRRRLRSLRKRRKLNEKKSKSKKVALDEGGSDESDDDDDEEERREEKEFNDVDTGASAVATADEIDGKGADQSMEETASQQTMPTQESNDGSPKMSGKKRIRKSLGATHEQEESDDEDFGAAAAPLKTKANFFEDDDDD